MQRIVIYTNFLLYISKFNIKLFAELERICSFSYEICILEGTLRELEKLINESRLSHKRAAKFALSMIQKKGIKAIKTSKDKCVDDLLLELDKSHIIATQDRELKSRLKKAGFRVVTMRQKKHLIMYQERMIFLN